MIPNKRGICWHPTCEKKIRHEIRVKLKTKKDNTFSCEMKACDEHFTQVLETEYFPILNRHLAHMKEPKSDD